MTFSAATPLRGLPAATQASETTDVIPDALSFGREITDENLIARICAGDKEALGILFKRHKGLATSIAARILRNGTEAEDLVQDLFIFIHRKCVIFDSSKSSARSWIVQMIYHRAIERRRYLTTRQFYSRGAQDVRGEVVGVPTVENDYSAEAVFGRNGLDKLIETLSEGQRETLRLHFFEGYTLAEIAEKLGQPQGNVRHHYYRALDKLRKQMFGTTVRVAEQHDK